MSSSSLQVKLARLDTKTLKAVHADIVNCAKKASIGGNYKAILVMRRQNSKSGLKDIYAALYKSTPETLKRMAYEILDNQVVGI